MIFYLNSSCDQTNPHELFFVKVHGHSGDPLHEEADRLAVEEADKESDNENTLYPGGWGQEMVSTGLMKQINQNHTLGAQQ